jgi:aarF domain-containing kinase
MNMLICVRRTGLVAGVGLTAASNRLKRSAGLVDDEGSALATRDNAEKLVQTLCRMRGAALKLGQVLSIQGMYGEPPQHPQHPESVGWLQGVVSASPCELASLALHALADSNLLPAELQDVFERVRQGADFMPAWQMEVRMARDWLCQGRASPEGLPRAMFMLAGGAWVHGIAVCGWGFVYVPHLTIMAWR